MKDTVVPRLCHIMQKQVFGNVFAHMFVMRSKVMVNTDTENNSLNHCTASTVFSRIHRITSH